MRMCIFAVAAAIAVVAGTPSAKAERSEMAWMFEEFQKNSTVGASRKRHTVRSERRQRVRVASVETDGDLMSDALPEPRRTARTERRQRVRVASIDRNVQVSAVGAFGYYTAGPRPGKWCGWWMRTQRGGGPEFNVAWNWRNYGSSTVPQVGAVVIWRHHVGEITGQTADGRWIVRSGNDGGRVRERARSVAGAIFRI